MARIPPKDPIEPTEKAEPIDPIEGKDLCDAMLSVEAVEAILQRDPDMCGLYVSYPGSEARRQAIRRGEIRRVNPPG